VGNGQEIFLEQIRGLGESLELLTLKGQAENDFGAYLGVRVHF